MPVKKLMRRPPTPALDALRVRLVQEWRQPAGAAQPVILEEGGTGGQPLHIYVVWDDWHDLPQVDRSDVIMDAFEEVRGSTNAINVTVAMGLTTQEANRLGIPY